MNRFQFISLVLVVLTLFNCTNESCYSCIDTQRQFEILEVDNEKYSLKLIIDDKFIIDSLPYDIFFEPTINRLEFSYKPLYNQFDTTINSELKHLKIDSDISAWFGKSFLTFTGPLDVKQFNDGLLRFKLTSRNDSLQFKDRTEFYTYYSEKNQRIISKVTAYHLKQLSIGIKFPVSDTTWTAHNKTECEPFVQLVDLKFK